MVRFKILQGFYPSKKIIDRLLRSSVVIKNPILNKINSMIANKKAVRMIKNGSLNLYLETHNYCNSKCKMCGYVNMRRKKEFMSDELFNSIIHQAKKLGVKTVFLHGTNEPLMDTKIVEKISYIVMNDMRVHLITNGSLLTENVAKKIIDAGVNEITISFDGFSKETYESVRVGLNFDIVKENIDKFLILRKNKSPLVRLHYVDVNNINSNEAKIFWKYWHGRVDEVIYYKAQDWAGQVNVCKNFIYYPYKLPCRLLWTNLNILSNGTVALCCIDYDGKVILGDLKEQTLEDIWHNSPILTRYRRAHLENKRIELELCKSCFSYSVWI